MGRSMIRKVPQLVRGSPIDEDPDEPVIRRLGSGDLDALGALYDRHAPALLRFARRSAPFDDAQDIVQTTFLRVSRIAARYDPARGSGRAWLYGVAAQVLRERRRSMARLTRMLARLGDAVSIPRAEDTPGQGDDAVAVDQALDRLSEAKRVTFLLVEVEGFSCEEVSNVLGVPIGTVWTRLHHARRELRAVLGEEQAK
ncbi:MAG: RNA polymerase sigma factor [Deltaproteobacteria bacterium]|nr:RNA polymerase sigma factor [Deltaproteobacteria bacterium]